MTAVIEGVIVTGTPDEIAQLINKMRAPKLTIGGGTGIGKQYPNNNIVLC